MLHGQSVNIHTYLTIEENVKNADEPGPWISVKLILIVPHVPVYHMKSDVFNLLAIRSIWYLKTAWLLGLRTGLLHICYKPIYLRCSLLHILKVFIQYFAYLLFAELD